MIFETWRLERNGEDIKKMLEILKKVSIVGDVDGYGVLREVVKDVISRCEPIKWCEEVLLGKDRYIVSCSLYNEEILITEIFEENGYFLGSLVCQFLGGLTFVDVVEEGDE
jgi:hypothetical protein